MIHERQPIPHVREDGTPREAQDIKYAQKVNVLRRVLETARIGAEHDVKAASKLNPVWGMWVSAATWGVRNADLWKTGRRAGQAKAETPKK